MSHIARSSSTATDVDLRDGDDQALFVHRARSIGAYIRKRAVRTRYRPVAWMAREAATGTQMPMDPYLYGGSGGTALFLAALDRVRGTDEHRDLIVGSTAFARGTFSTMAGQPGTAPSGLLIGGLVGIGAFVYTMARLAEWTGMPELLDEARAATRLLTIERISADPHLDVVHGSAGTILALLALDAAHPGPNAAGRTPLDIASECAAHLLERRTTFDGRARAWPSGGGAPRPGFAHGPAGIGYALLRLYARTGNARLREAALEGFAYEDDLYDPAERDWWNPRFSRFLEVQSWCTGAPGIALSRLALDDARGALATTLDVTAAQVDGPVDDLCCGNLGRADVLLSAGCALGDEELVRTGRSMARRAVERASGNDDFGFISEVPARTLSLFRGVAGIGWGLLRQAHPEALPSCLMLE